MCGIIGVINIDGKPVAGEVYKGLLSLQHRGQDSTGILCFDKVRMNVKKGIGLVSQVFSEQNLSLLKGSMGLGHVRYCTVGSLKSSKVDAAPFAVSIPYSIATTHNSNLINYSELRERYSSLVESECDGEVMLLLLAEELKKADGDELTPEEVFTAVGQVMKQLHGSYSVVALIGRLGLLAFRDPHGIRPLVMGKREDAFAFASESVALDVLGFDLERDVKPGEAVLIGMNGKVHSRVLNAQGPKHCFFEWIYFARPDSIIEGKSVYEVRLELGRKLAKYCKTNGDEVVVPVPDTSRSAAQGLADELGLNSREGLIKNRYVPRTFILPTGQRENATRVNLNPVKSVLKGKTVLLVDDSIVRGTTSKRIIRIVKEHADKVHFLVTCPRHEYPCYYGIDFPVKDELIAAHKTNDEIREDIGADELTYIDIDDMQDAIGLKGELCMACLNGDYPTPISEEDVKKMEAERKKERHFC
ncbi:MAG: amidophosphoribosyltransferase [Candidatus Micrarchaeota archaeon]